MHIFHIFKNLAVIFLFQLIHRGEHTFSVDVAVMPNSCAVYNRRNGYKSQPYDGNFHYFPSDEVKRQAWSDVLPNAHFKWRPKTSVCAIFTGQPTLRLQEPRGRMFPPSHSRFSGESLQPVPVKLIVTPYHVISSQGVCLKKQGRTGNREGSSRNSQKLTQLLAGPNLLNIVTYRKDGNVARSMALIKLSEDSPPSIIYSMEITERYEITCYLSAAKIPVFKNSFDKRLTKYSQLNSILSMVEIQSFNVKQLSEKCSQQVRRLRELATNEDQSNRVEFLSSQLDLNASKPEGRRYTTAQYRQAIDLCLRGRNSDKALRKFCILPSMKPIHKLFGCMSTVGSITECREVVSNAMVNLSGKQKWCKILVDEVHIKPAIRYRGNHLIGSAIDDPTKAARTALTITVCPLMGGPSFVVRILPIYSVTHEIMYDVISCSRTFW